MMSEITYSWSDGSHTRAGVVVEAPGVADTEHAPCWLTPLPRPPGIYWRRTGGKTHTVEVVR